MTDGRRSWDEALFGIIPGVIVLALSIVLGVAGLVVMMLGRKRQAAAR